MQAISDALELAVVPVTPFQQNCSLVRCRASGQGAVVDPGGEVDKLLAAIEESGTSVESILLTHGHADHAGGTAALARELSVPVIGPHEEDRFWLESLAEQGRAFGLSGAEDVVPERWLNDGDEVSVGRLRLAVRHCPGHTPGHVVFLHAGSRFAWVGDVLFRGSIGRSDFPRGDYDTLIRSIQERLLPLGDDVRFLSGHGPMSSFGEERRTNPFLVSPERFRS